MKGILFVLTAFFVLLSSDLDARSERIRVSLNVDTTEIVRADLRVDDHYYYIDTNACICWVARLIGGNNSIATVDCEKLFAHERLQKYLEKCADPSLVISKLETVKKVEEVKMPEEEEKDAKE